MKYLRCFLLFVTPWFCFGQNADNIQDLTPSVLLKEGRLEIKSFNNIYSQRSVFDDRGNRVDSNVRSTFLASVTSALYGKSDRVNYGVELWIRSRRDDSRDTSPFSILKFESGPESRTELAYLGPKVKFRPFKSKSNFSIQSTLLFPFALDLDGSDNADRIFVDDDRTIWINQFFLDNGIGDKWNIFTEIATWLSLDRDGSHDNSKLEVPVKGFLSYFATRRCTLYFSSELWSRLNSNWVDGYFFASGIGSKFQIIQGLLEAEILYTKFLLGKSMGAGSTYNLGIRWVSWTKSRD